MKTPTTKRAKQLSLNDKIFFDDDSCRENSKKAIIAGYDYFRDIN